MFEDTKRDRVVTYYERLPLITSLDPYITWSCEVMWQVKYFIFSLSQDLWPLNLIECWLRGGLTSKRLSRRQLFLPYLSAIFFQVKSRFLNRVKSTFFYFFGHYSEVFQNISTSKPYFHFWILDFRRNLGMDIPESMIFCSASSNASGHNLFHAD